MTDRYIREIAREYIDYMQRITDAQTPEERIRLRNEVIAHPVLGRIYIGPMS